MEENRTVPFSPYPWPVRSSHSIQTYGQCVWNHRSKRTHVRDMYLPILLYSDVGSKCGSQTAGLSAQ